MCGDPQSIEAAPALADHADLAVAPGLARDPGDRRAGVLLFERQIFVVEQTLAVTGPAHVDADGGIAMAGEPAMHLLVARTGAITLAVGDIFEDRRHRTDLGILGQPEP